MNEMNTDTPAPEGEAFGIALADLTTAMLENLSTSDPAEYAFVIEAIGDGALLTITSSWSVDCMGATTLTVTVAGGVHEIGSMHPVRILDTN